MRTRRGFAYPSVGAPTTRSRKIGKLASLVNFFDMLSDDIVLLILIKLAASAGCPADFVAALLACKRFNCLGLKPSVLSKASAETFAVSPGSVSSARWFFVRCARAGNVEAHYIMGMINFYCFRNYKIGVSLITQAAMKSHPQALYSLAIIQFNGSGGTDVVKDPSAGVTLCTRAAFLGHVDAIRELGYCLQDGYGVAKDIAKGKRYLIDANIREMETASLPALVTSLLPGLRPNMPPILFSASNFVVTGTWMRNRMFSLPPPSCHPVNRFLVTWHNSTVADDALPLRSCSYGGCGRIETYAHEFRRCGGCGVNNYCSRGCQARDWTMSHRMNCRPLLRFPIFNAGI